MHFIRKKLYLCVCGGGSGGSSGGGGLPMLCQDTKLKIVKLKSISVLLILKYDD